MRVQILNSANYHNFDMGSCRPRTEPSNINVFCTFLKFKICHLTGADAPVSRGAIAPFFGSPSFSVSYQGAGAPASGRANLPGLGNSLLRALSRQNKQGKLLPDSLVAEFLGRIGKVQGLVFRKISSLFSNGRFFEKFGRCPQRTNPCAFSSLPHNAKRGLA